MAIDKINIDGIEIPVTDGGGGSESWTTIYDKDSADETLNLGFTSGIIPLAGEITAMPDLTPYNYLRVHWMINTVTVLTTLDIGARRDLENAFYILTNLGTQSSNIVGYQIVLNYDDTGKRVFNANTGRKIQLSNGTYPSYENLKDNASYYIFKIEAM